jgi:hypothetical protein
VEVQREQPTGEGREGDHLGPDAVGPGAEELDDQRQGDEPAQLEQDLGGGDHGGVEDELARARVIL